VSDSGSEGSGFEPLWGHNKYISRMSRRCQGDGHSVPFPKWVAVGVCVLAAALVTGYIGFRDGCCSRGSVEPVVILFDNDVHCAVDGYATIAGLRDAIEEGDTASCLMVSSGDYVQGGAIGMLTKGRDIVALINRSGYDVVTIGNHEFDYGMRRCEELADELAMPVTCVNLTRQGDEAPLFEPYVLVEAGGRTIAFIGVLTPMALVYERAAFYDSTGCRVYDVHEEAICRRVQGAVNKARRKGADYVVVLAHLGEDDGALTGPELIHGTWGIDVVLDGHSHTVLPGQTEINKHGEPVLLTQTGTEFQYIGKLYISKTGEASVTLIKTDSVDYCSAMVTAVLDSVEEVNGDLLNRTLATSKVALRIDDEQGQRKVRMAETNCGDFIADAFRVVAGAQIGVQNGGGIRTTIPAGEVTMRQLLNCAPFSNALMVLSVKGSDIMRLLAWGVEGVTDGCENGFFPQVSGLQYTIYAEQGGRVGDVKVLDAATGRYEPIDTARCYTVAMTDYLKRETGSFLKLDDVVKAYVSDDIAAIITYLDMLGHVIGWEYAKPQGRVVME